MRKRNEAQTSVPLHPHEGRSIPVEVGSYRHGVGAWNEHGWTCGGPLSEAGGEGFDLVQEVEEDEMKINQSSIRIFLLELTEEEGRILKAWCQNSRHERLSDEPENEGDFRHALFESLKNFLGDS